MKKIVKALAVLSLAALFGGIALTQTACPGTTAGEGEGEGEGGQ